MPNLVSNKLNRRAFFSMLSLPLLAGSLAACSSDSKTKVLKISAIPDQDPDILTEREELMAAYLAQHLDIEVEYVPVADYAASVSLFAAGDLDLVFYGGLTGVQARLQAPDSRVLAQRDIDEKFTSIFVAHKSSSISEISTVAELSRLKGKRLTFGSQTSTSGRLMPSYFLREAGLTEADFAGEVGFSGSHDATLELVNSGTFEVGALNSQVYQRALADASLGENIVKIFETPTYHDYHWILGAQADSKFGADFGDELLAALTSLNDGDEDGAAILEAYGASSIIEAKAEDYAQIEQIARELDLLG